MSSWFPRPFSKRGHFVMNRIPGLERAPEATQLKSHLIDLGWHLRGKGTQSHRAPQTVAQISSWVLGSSQGF